MNHIIEQIADFADIDTRRALGVKPCKLVIPDLPIQFAFRVRQPYGVTDPRDFFMELNFDNGTKHFIQAHSEKVKHI